MAKENETVADIVAEMRRYATDYYGRSIENGGEKGNPGMFYLNMAQFAKVNADRLDAVAKRMEWTHKKELETRDAVIQTEVAGREAEREAHKREIDEMLDALVRIGNWCAQDLGENAYVSDSSGNYLKTLNGLCEVCRPYMQKASKLKRYGGAK